MWHVVNKKGDIVSNHRTKKAAEKSAFDNRKSGQMLVKKTGADAQIPQWVIRENERRIRLEVLKEMHKDGNLNPSAIMRGHI